MSCKPLAVPKATGVLVKENCGMTKGMGSVLLDHEKETLASPHTGTINVLACEIQQMAQTNRNNKQSQPNSGEERFCSRQVMCQEEKRFKDYLTPPGTLPDENKSVLPMNSAAIGCCFDLFV